MVGKTHIAGGLALVSVSSVVLYKTGMLSSDQMVVQQATLLASAGLGALIPDIDMRGSKISRKNPIISFFCRIFLTHRGFTHSPLALLLFSAAVLYITKKLGYDYGIWAGMGLSIGYASHILLDMFNPKGVPLLYPYKEKFSFGKVVTGTWVETFILLFCLLIAVICEGMLFGVLRAR